jgi:hypothetical protein
VDDSRRQIGTQIRFLCTSHPTHVPTVTMHEDRWAYCPGGYIAAHAGHVWTAIEPVNVTDLKPRHVGFAPALGLGISRVIR